jgi:rieske iron-sulfur protein
MPNCHESRRSCLHRRQMLNLGLAAVATPVASPAFAYDFSPRGASVAVDDFLCFSSGPREGSVINPVDVVAGQAPITAWPMAPDQKLVKYGSRFNLVLVVRLDPKTLDEAESVRAADGIVAFSAICTHAACTVSGWLPDAQHFRCPCHLSEYDPKHGCEVVFGPAPRPLPALPLKIVDQSLRVASGFTDRVGGGASMTD